MLSNNGSWNFYVQFYVYVAHEYIIDVLEDMEQRHQHIPPRQIQLLLSSDYLMHRISYNEFIKPFILPDI